MISNVVIIHGGNSENDKNYNKHWMLWVKEKLGEKKIKVYSPLMPVDSKATYEDWKKIFERIDIDENSILIGHSRGAAFLVRWIGESKTKVRKLILVAPCKIATVDYKRNFYDFEINPEINDFVGEIIIFYSDNDMEHVRKSVVEYKNYLDCKMIEMKGYGHFTEYAMGTMEFPELLEKILE